ncbi:MAG: DUF3244 domain-containing protein [Saprospiraceae bacterium]|nr:DUF3244 domain-containing protein [Saprospiraceae bacterium]
MSILITSPPVADFEMQYLSGNTIRITDKSLDANLFSIDYDFEGEMYQGNPKTNTLFSYTENGKYNLTQTSENLCGFATQTIPVLINLPPAFNTTNIKASVEKLPFSIKQGESMEMDISKLKVIKNLSIIIKDEDYKSLTILNTLITSEEKSVLINTSNLEEGAYFIEFLGDEKVMMTKRILVR